MLHITNSIEKSHLSHLIIFIRINNYKFWIKNMSRNFQPSTKIEILRQYNELENKLGGVGASKRTATLIHEDLINE